MQKTVELSQFNTFPLEIFRRFQAPPVTMPTPKPQPQVDPYKYGWRYVPRTNLDGEIYFEQVPLTLEDVLHPQEEDFHMHTYDHENIVHYLATVCRKQLVADPSAFVLADVRVAWKKINVAHGPDIAVVFGVKEKKNWSTFYETVEGTRPCLIIEVTSPETRRNDLIDKVTEYAQAGVEYYIIVDIHKNKCSLRGYELTPLGYVPLKATQGRLWLKPVRLWLALGADDEIECYDQRGQLILEYTEVEKAWQKAELRAEAESKRAETESKRAETESKRAETESKRAETESKRAETESKRAEAEAEARAKLEAELRELKAKYGLI